ncbi:DUF2974 domain-containing protein [Lysobacter sp. 5GHs7-4]|uniref:XVIPCD domain-containing protein n=1 Tax=Lysobacter sp. 5GHs7-4 TaxID=2904253 RepID=UPI001E643CD5|nr:XVIPCD domain-containing protein [Lysobacter sp. 5GHs7-4]UHQ22131.1 DUF2974 domain-containing protein [Lysobacter sp. 5GHs7-4]
MNAQIDPDRLRDQGPRPSFADEVRGQNAQPVDMTLAKLMRDVYDYDRNGRQEGVGAWKPMGEDELRQAGIDPTLLKNQSSGFLAVIYGDGQGRHVLAYSGTDEAKDWLTNFGQGLGFETSQYNQAMALARQAKVAFGQDMVITGHSLGGGLAAAAAVSTDTPAITFNASGVHDKTLERIGLDPDAVKREAGQGLIRRYAVDNEILTELQENKPIIRHLMPDALGHKIELPDPDPQSFWQRLNPVKSIKHGVEMHYIDAVIEAQEKKFGKDFENRAEHTAARMNDPAHPANPLYRQSYDGVQGSAVARGLNGGQTEQLAGALALEAQRGGLQRIDQVVFGEDGRRAFAVEGQRPESQRVAHVDVAVAREQPLAHSSEQSLQLAQRNAAQAQPGQGQEPPSATRGR